MLNLKENIVDVALKSLKWFIVGFLLFAHTSCTTAPNGAINKVVPEPQAEGYNVFDKLRQINHVYSQPVILHHKDKLTLYCRQHKKWEIVMAFWEPTEDDYYYIVNEHRKW